MFTEKPLTVSVRPRRPAFVKKFIEELLAVFEHTNQVRTVASTEELVLECLWEPDLEWAMEQVRRTFPGELLWSKPSVVYTTRIVGNREVLCEPMLKVRVRTPDEVVGTVMGELSSRRGMILGMDDIVGGKVVSAQVPLSELFGYCSWLAQNTDGRGSAEAEFDSYMEAPRGPEPDPNEPMSAALRA